MGRYEGGRCQKNPISSIQDWQITIFLLQSFEIVITIQKDFLLDPVLDPVLDLLLDPFLAFLDPLIDPLLDLFFYFFTYLLMSKMTPILHI